MLKPFKVDEGFVPSMVNDGDELFSNGYVSRGISQISVLLFMD